MNWILISDVIGCLPYYLLLGSLIAKASLHFRKEKSESVLAVPFFPNRASWGWHNDCNEDRYQTLVDRAHCGREKPTLAVSTYYVITCVTWPVRLALNVSIALWVLATTIFVYVVYSRPTADHMLRQWCDMKRPD